MIKKMTILYEIHGGLYVNLTNKCPCNCTFCLRQEGDGAHGSDSLWLEHEPSLEEVIEAFEEENLSKYKEVIFCGYGEPTTRLETLIEVCKYIRSKSDIKIRLNTNGLGDLIHGKPVAHLLKGYIDAISISLNAPTAEEYLAVTRPKFGIESFDAMLKFASEAKDYVPKVTLSVVDTIGEEAIEKCRKIAEDIGVSYRVREYV
ncbi:TIGR04100 family radical SAM protein [Cellulosilyticum ruminicola]|uniref:TIGR04100 family radical SAM protein n=1 Tax=Cellulosilyticum ruminicola TaxID=425254 RepID=UPI000AB6F092|nr:TIGR04100 family radical SAM protein [Cellulosilyticum ruminicola]